MDIFLYELNHIKVPFTYYT